MKLDNYKKLLEQHDWYYEFADDGDMFRRGKRMHDELYQVAKENGDEFKVAFNEAHDRAFKLEPRPKGYMPPFILSESKPRE